MPTAKGEKSSEIVIHAIKTGRIGVTVIGEAPIIVNRLSEKAKRELLLPTGRKSEAQRAASLKHDPLAEFRASPYLLRDDTKPTYLAALAAWFKNSMETAALDLPGVAKTQVERHVWVEGERLPLYGVPRLLMSPVRSADIARTPDIHTRAIVPRWTVDLVIRFTEPLLNQQSVVNLLVAAGTFAGVADWRPEKGGTHGRFAVADHDDPRVLAIKAEGGRAAQVAAMDKPGFYDVESEELFAWFEGEVGRRGKGELLSAMPEAAD